MNWKLSLIALAIVGVASGSTVAADMPKEGSYDFVACWTIAENRIEFSKGNTAMSFEVVGTTNATSPGGPFDKESFRCVGSNAFFGKRVLSIVTCEAMNREGDKRLSYYQRGADGVYDRENVAGTGKYEGLIMTGKAVPLGPYPEVKPGTNVNCNRQTGTYKLK